ncbi:MAG: TIGR04255 family protein [Nitrospirales bacterium]
MPKTQSSVLQYQKTPLAQVVCQLSFPTTLQISSQPPTGFQTRVRPQFPLFSLSANQKAYNFFAKDRLSHITLDSQSLSFVTPSYEGWQVLRDRLTVPVKAVCQEFAPPFFVRVGLRFSNVIRRSSLGLEDREWGELLQSKAANVGAWDEVSQNVHGSRTEVVMTLDDPSQRLRVIHGVVNVKGVENEKAYLLDHDFFAEKDMSMDDAFQCLDDFHDRAGQLFRWWISDTLHTAML